MWEGRGRVYGITIRPTSYCSSGFEQRSQRKETDCRRVHVEEPKRVRWKATQSCCRRKRISPSARASGSLTMLEYVVWHAYLRGSGAEKQVG